MAIHPVKTVDDYNTALLRVDELMDARPGTAEGDELDVLATLIEAYERNHFPIDPPDPVEVEILVGHDRPHETLHIVDFEPGRNCPRLPRLENPRIVAEHQQHFARASRHGRDRGRRIGRDRDPGGRAGRHHGQHVREDGPRGRPVLPARIPRGRSARAAAAPAPGRRDQ